MCLAVTTTTGMLLRNDLPRSVGGLVSCDLEQTPQSNYLFLSCINYEVILKAQATTM